MNGRFKETKSVNNIWCEWRACSESIALHRHFNAWWNHGHEEVAGSVSGGTFHLNHLMHRHLLVLGTQGGGHYELLRACCHSLHSPSQTQACLFVGRSWHLAGVLCTRLAFRVILAWRQHLMTSCH